MTRISRALKSELYYKKIKNIPVWPESLKICKDSARAAAKLSKVEPAPPKKIRRKVNQKKDKPKPEAADGKPARSTEYQVIRQPSKFTLKAPKTNSHREKTLGTATSPAMHPDIRITPPKSPKPDQLKTPKVEKSARPEKSPRKSPRDTKTPRKDPKTPRKDPKTPRKEVKTPRKHEKSPKPEKSPRKAEKTPRKSSKADRETYLAKKKQEKKRRKKSRKRKQQKEQKPSSPVHVLPNGRMRASG